MDGRIPDVLVPIIGNERKDGTIKSMELEELDKITVTFEDGNAIRKCDKYKLMVDEALNDYQYLTSTFKKNSNGSLSVVYLNNNYQPIKMKTLYAKDKDKLDVHNVVNEVFDYFNGIGSNYSKYFILEYGDLALKNNPNKESYLESIDIVMRSTNVDEIKDNRKKVLIELGNKMHELLDDPKTRSKAYFELRRMDSTMRNAMKKSHHKISDLVANEKLFEENTDNYILVEESGQIVMDMGQIVDGKSVKKVKVK